MDVALVDASNVGCSFVPSPSKDVVVALIQKPMPVCCLLVQRCGDRPVRISFLLEGLSIGVGCGAVRQTGHILPVPYFVLTPKVPVVQLRLHATDVIVVMVNVG